MGYVNRCIGYFAARQSLLIALVLALALIDWMLLGQLRKPLAMEQDSSTMESVPSAMERPTAGRDSLMRVRVRSFAAQRISREIVISGRTEPARAVTLRAELDGRVAAISTQRGARVTKGDILLHFDQRDREARLREAQAAVQRWEFQYGAERRLSRQRARAEVQRAEALTQLEAARARLKRIEMEITNTVVRAPFDGVLEQRSVEVGDYVRTGDPLARILEQDPIRVIGAAAQHEVQYLQVGAPGTVRLVTGREVAGRVRYIAFASDPATHTFRVELEVPNPDGNLVAGTTSEIHIPAGEIVTHHFSPALLSLNEAGEMGVKGVNANNRVVFHPVRIVRSTAEGVWVEGLPESVRLITVGQGFVQPGERVRAVPDGRMADDAVLGDRA